jgi:D-serine deaminase-like pyridoxal phosphate-dependent protein
MVQNIFSQIKTPTLLLDEKKAKRNIRRMSHKAKKYNVRFRPHFKTHQSAVIGEWFREEGVQAITVSSVEMASYFADHGWKDILIAFSLNWREIKEINSLARRVQLGILVESPETVVFAARNLDSLVKVWVKIDTGLHRTGISVEDMERVFILMRKIKGCKNLRLTGVLTHAGHTYHANSPADIINLYQQSVNDINTLRNKLQAEGVKGLQISVGDTPGCRLSQALGQVDEIRPGNFVFYDAMQWQLGVCDAREIAVAVACPVVAKHTERSEIVIYGGAAHLSKEMLLRNGQAIYGYLSMPERSGWSSPLEGCFIFSLTQEHGIIKVTSSIFEKVQVGGLVCIIPVHSCLVVSALKSYVTTHGEKIKTLISGDSFISRSA